ncbi:DNA-directed RNA polymerase [Candidatus Woesearchaeota archaeon]|nr:DNA-directed RNA polymerase [Candidatus Woesearchaeota archaeon]
MFYQVKIKDHIRVPPESFGLELEQSIIKEIKKKYSGFISKNFGFVIDIASIVDVGEGVLIPEDGAIYYSTTFNIITFEPEMHEVVHGAIKDIADFGAFINIGPVDGMIHISQTMNDFVSFSKDKTLQGKEKKRSLRVGDKCKARIIAISYKDIANPKLGLTMRQQGLGKDEWIVEDIEKKTGKAEADA